MKRRARHSELSQAQAKNKKKQFFEAFLARKKYLEENQMLGPKRFWTDKELQEKKDARSAVMNEFLKSIKIKAVRGPKR